MPGGHSSSGKSHIENLVPLALQGGDGIQLGPGDGHTIAQGQVRTREVVVGDEEGGEG